MDKPIRLVRTGMCVVLAGALAACGGGGGSTPSTSPVNPPITTVPASGTLSVPGQQSSGGGAGGFVNDGHNPSTYAVTSNPSGRSFSVGAQSYVTPATVTPAASTSALSIVFDSGYTVPIVQVYDGAHTVFYNAAADSTGTVSFSSLQAFRRQAASASHVRVAAGRPAAARASGRSLGRVAHRSFRHARFPGGDVDPTRLAVRLSASALRSSGRSPEAIERAVGSVGRETLSSTADRLRIVPVPAGTDVAAFTRALQAQPEVAEVTPVHRRHLLARAATPQNDPYFALPSQWYDFATGANFAWSYSPGTGAKLAIIDTGIDENNTDLTSQVTFQETDVTPIDNSSGNSTCMPVSGALTQVTAGTAADDNGHGTDVAGIAISAANSTGFVGTAYGAQLLAFKIFPNQNAYCNDDNVSLNRGIGASSADEAQAIADAVAQGADVISLSLGSSDFDTTEFNAIEKAIAAGVTVVAAAGNSDDASGAGTLDYPSAYPGVISVGASALKDEYYATQYPPGDGTYATSTEIVASYSQYGPSLSVVAPGGDAVNYNANACAASTAAGNSAQCDNDTLHWIANYSSSTAYLPDEQCSTPSPATDCLSLFNGTSMATPQVSATAALLVAEAGGHGRLSPAQIKYVIETTADNINDPKQGHGRLNAYRALASLVRDTSAFSGPTVQATGDAQLVAFAYATGRTNKPAIADASYPAGVPVAANGTFRIADVPATTGTYGVAVWYDANADGVIDAGDLIGTAATKCSPTTACAIGTVSLGTAPAGYYLP